MNSNLFMLFQSKSLAELKSFLNVKEDPNLVPRKQIKMITVNNVT